MFRREFFKQALAAIGGVLGIKAVPAAKGDAIYCGVKSIRGGWRQLGLAWAKPEVIRCRAERWTITGTLEPVGRDHDGKIKPLAELSYRNCVGA